MKALIPQIIFAIVLGTIIGIIDFTNEEVQPTIFLILLNTFILGFLYERYFWLFAAIVGSGIFIGHNVMLFLGFSSIASTEPNQFADFIALIPAFIGAASGVVMKKILTPKASSKNNP